MAQSPDLGAGDSTGGAYGYEALYCIESSIIPTSLGVNPSLTISAVSERCAEALVGRAGDLSRPPRPPGLQPGGPDEIVGGRVIPPPLRRCSCGPGTVVTAGAVAAGPRGDGRLAGVGERR